MGWGGGEAFALLGRGRSVEGSIVHHCNYKIGTWVKIARAALI